MANCPKILEAFGIPSDIGSMVSDATKSVDVTKLGPREPLLKIGLAPSFEPDYSLKDSFNELDDELKVIILGATNVIRKMPPHTRNWEGVVAEFSNTSMLELQGKEIRKVDQYLSETSADFKFDGSPDPRIVDKVKSWFTALIDDQDILKRTRIDIELIAKIVAQSGATITDFDSFWSKKERHEGTVLDFGVLRYPDTTRKHIEVYKIKLTAWSDCTRVLWNQEDKNGITGEFVRRIYIPREEVLEKLSPRIKEQAIQAAEALFSVGNVSEAQS